ncbi:hypothetical protein EZV62_007729 [Acer yangbiense]|uniref:MULE transposase domain-containing protein n=1 Tax=Acer yangbiense TaxID=1000413 RepID=A0A5C7IBD6_9ROSI|nr:hypothetical protein EZV62_007729 [Acer yangbiense]
MASTSYFNSFMIFGLALAILSVAPLAEARAFFVFGEQIGRSQPPLPYLSPVLKGYKLLNGANFASAGIGILNDTGIQFLNITKHDETEPWFTYNPKRVPNQYDEQFAYIQRLVPPPYAFYSINSAEVAPRPVTMRLEVGELFQSKKQLQSQLGSYALTNRFQIRVFKSDTTWLHKAVGEVDNLVTVSDRKGSITTGVEKVFPNSFHGACVVHLEQNMVGHCGRNKTLKQYFQRAAKVYQESQFLQRMEQLANINLEVAQYVTDVGIKRWACKFATYSGEIHHIGQPSEWLVPEDIASKIVHPLVSCRGPRRPKKNRSPSFGEEVTQRSCTICHRVGHNSHTCTYPKSSRPSSSMGNTSEIGEASESHDVVA